ncbi:uncharacterized protein ACHE_20659S [Aspergillus chevalieri]|uniref:Uncharacterized protein n=1 Tax=Aspergillus chevalieri TaxID=182096 RepID=A0A7R7VI88_ASPCH|nr:uncharacterized protein ACHE_20659S [Aspergillus chevalieri]BCR85201.1 hypothetical protein ACHE_20659S [Aspergillus chevalieri]
MEESASPYCAPHLIRTTNSAAKKGSIPAGTQGSNSGRQPIRGRTSATKLFTFSRYLDA